jgi:hypothetical protein
VSKPAVFESGILEKAQIKTTVRKVDVLEGAFGKITYHKGMLNEVNIFCGDARGVEILQNFCIGNNLYKSAVTRFRVINMMEAVILAIRSIQLTIGLLAFIKEKHTYRVLCVHGMCNRKKPHCMLISRYGVFN